MSGKFDITIYVESVLDTDKLIEVILNKGINNKI